MLSAQAYTFGKKARLAVSLAWVGGFVDAIGFIELAVYTSNMTGNTATLGQRLAEGAWQNAAYIYFLLFAFLAGAMLSGLLIETARRARLRGVYTAALGVEAFLLVAVVTYSATGGSNLFLRGFLPCLAMGLQNATVTRISGSVVRTTHVTGIITDLGLETVQFLFFLRDRYSARRRILTAPTEVAATALRAIHLTRNHPTFQRLLLLGGIWTTFLLGAALGAVVWSRFGIGSLLAPALFLLVMIVLERLTPLASVDAVDRAARARTFAAFGIEPEIVPDAIGIYVLGTHDSADTTTPHAATATPPAKSRRRIRPPDLGELHLHTRPDERIVILVLADDIDLDDNALVGLSNSLAALRAADRHLVMCVSTHDLFDQVGASEFLRELGPANLCSDPEFAVARALDLLPPGPTG